MARTGLKNESLVNSIEISGSLALPNRNDSGVYEFKEKQQNDGVVSGKLVKPKYNVDELIKSIDTTIFELLPIEEPELPETVLKVIYDAALEDIRLRDITIAEQTDIILDLRAKVSELEIVSQSLRVEVDGKELLVANADNLAAQSTNKVSTTIIDLQNAIQKATAESIQRVSLFARNQSLKEQNDILRETLFGKQAKQAEGAKVTDDLAAKVMNKSDEQFNDITFRGRAKDDGNGTFINGPDIQLKNFTKDKITVSFKFEGDTAKAFGNIANVDLAGGEEKIIKVSTVKKEVDGFRPGAGAGLTGDKQYTGNLIIKSPKGSITFTTAIQKMRGDKFSP